MSCSCIRNEFSVKIDYTDCRHLVLSDRSLWMDEASFFEKGSSLPLSITDLSLGKTFDITLFVDSRNIYDSLDILGIEDTCINDTIFCISTVSCGVGYTINRAYLCATNCKIQQLVAKAKTSQDWAFIRELKSLVESVETNAEFGKVDTAKGLLHLLNEKLKSITCGSCR